MATHPEIQRRAQQEIDDVVGPGRLVTLDDRESLPYVEALNRELMRWKPVLPLGVAHCTTQNDVYKGHFIPKGKFLGICFEQRSDGALIRRRHYYFQHMANFFIDYSVVSCSLTISTIL